MSGVSIATGVIATDALGGGEGRGLQSPGVRAQSSVTGMAVTGTTNETTLASIIIPANMLGINGMLRITALWSYTNSANNKTLRVNFGGTTWFNQVQTTTASAQSMTMIRNRGAANSQVGYAISAGSAFGSTSVANPTAAIDTTASQSITITGQLVNTGETITLESYTVEVLNP